MFNGYDWVVETLIVLLAGMEPVWAVGELDDHDSCVAITKSHVVWFMPVV